MYIYVHMCICVHMRTCAYAHMYAYICTHVHMHICAYAHMHIWGGGLRLEECWCRDTSYDGLVGKACRQRRSSEILAFGSRVEEEAEEEEE